MSNKQQILKVAINVPIHRLFDYLANDESFSVGQYVTIPFGRRKIIGVIYSVSFHSDIHPSKLKKVINVDPEIIFDEEYFLENGKEISRIYIPLEQKVSIHNKNTWRDVMVFFNETMNQFELFFEEYRDILED